MNEDLNISPANNIPIPTSVNFKFHTSEKTSLSANVYSIIKLSTTNFNNGGFVLLDNGSVQVPYTGIISLVGYTYMNGDDAPQSAVSWRATAIKLLPADAFLVLQSTGNQSAKASIHQNVSVICGVTKNEVIALQCYCTAVSKIGGGFLCGNYLSIEQ